MTFIWFYFENVTGQSWPFAIIFLFNILLATIICQTETSTLFTTLYNIARLFEKQLKIMSCKETCSCLILRDIDYSL